METFKIKFNGLILKKLLLTITFLLLSSISTAPFCEQQLPKLFLYVGNDANLTVYQKVLSKPYIAGVQVMYTWKELEPSKNVYNFSRIENDLRFLNSMHKQLFIQLQDRSFQPNLVYVPDYIRQDSIYHGGVAQQYDFPGEGKPITTGWVARVWDPAVQMRFQLLIRKLASQYDGRIYGINLPETAVDFNPHELPTGFTPDKYFQAEIQNMLALRQAFTKSLAMQYINFFPGEWNNDHNYMGRLFATAIKNNIALGGPDVVPYRKGQMKNSYPFFHLYNKKLISVGMAVQEGDYTYQNPKTKDYYNYTGFYQFARDYLGATILFWNTQEPFFSQEFLPKISDRYFESPTSSH